MLEGGLERSDNQMSVPEIVAITLSSPVQRAHLLIINFIDTFSVTTTRQAPLHMQDMVLQKMALLMSFQS